MFDDKKEVTLTGVVKEFQYTNPHSWLLVDVKGPDGKVTTWGFEAEGPSTLQRAGIRKSDFAPGTTVTITGHPMRDGRPAAAWVRATRDERQERVRAAVGLRDSLTARRRLVAPGTRRGRPLTFCSCISRRDHKR